MTEQPSRSGEAFEDWTLYEKIIALNYMRHREVAEAVRWLTSQLCHPLHVLDLGCGDGWMATHGLGGSNVVSYLGVDLSSDALGGAMTNLSFLSPSVSLREADLTDIFRHEFDPPPNLVLASYSLHHFPLEEVCDLIRKLHDSMAAPGCLVWIDLQRGEQESRLEFLKRFYDQRLPEWKTLTGDEVKAVMEHMTGADFPLSAVEKREVTAAAGFEASRTLYEDDYYAADAYTRRT